MSYAYSEEYLAQLRASAQTQQASTAWAEVNSAYETILNTQPNLTAYDYINSLPDYIESETASYGKAYKTVTFNNAGEAIGVDFVDVNQTVVNPPAVIDSNISNAAYGGSGNRVLVNGSAGGTRPNVMSKGAKFLSTDLQANTLASKIGWGIAAVSLGTKLGKFISQGIYDVTGAWQYDPANWSSIVESDNIDDLDKWAFRTLFGLDDETGSVTPYLNSDALGAMFLTLLATGAYSQGDYSIDTESIDTSMLNNPSNYDFNNALPNGTTVTLINPTTGAFRTYEFTSGSGYTYVNLPSDTVTWVSDQPFTAMRTLYNAQGVVTSQETYTGYALTYKNTTYYTTSAAYWNVFNTGASISNPTNFSANQPQTWDLAYVSYNYITESGGSPDWIEDDTTGATYIPTPDTITGTDLSTVNQQLRQNYPDLYDGEIYEDVPQPDGTTKRITYIPVPFPNTTDKTKPITGDNHQNNPTSNPTTNTDDQLKDIIQLITGILTPKLNPNTDLPQNPVPPDTGDGDTPPVIVPTGSASSLWAVYNPTQAQVDAFGSWLWSSNFVDQLKKLFNDPMQAIIGIHKVFATPATGETRTIVCGYIDSGVPSAIVTSQYTTVNCGSINLREYFGNVFDYSPFTELSLYLPFIGIVKLDVADVMRASITVRYHVDVITGACLADVIVTRDAAGGVLYQYAGSAIVTYPISSGSYASAMAGVLSIAGGIAGTIASGGALAPALLGAAVGASHLHSDVQKSGSFSGAAGAMGGKIPYLIISRPQTAMPSSFKHLEGYPANHYTKLGDASGYVKVRAVQVKGINATDTELDMIDAALRQGVEL